MAAEASHRQSPRLTGLAAGSDSVVLAVSPANSPWTATTNATWLHLTADNQSGTGSTNVIFTFDANSGATHTGTLTIAGQTITITQAGSTYAPVTNTTTLVSSNAITPLSKPYGVAVDGAGNVYIADTYNQAIKEWIAVSNSVTTLVSSLLFGPYGVAVDGTGNVYFCSGNTIMKWTAASNAVTTLVSSNAITPLNQPCGVAVDGAGNVYIADSGNNAIKMWNATSSNVSLLVSSNATTPLNNTRGIALDSSSNIFIADAYNNAIKKWTLANNKITTLVSSNDITPLNYPAGVAVDGAGNVYIVDARNNAIKEWNVASNTVATLVSSNATTPLNRPLGVAVDGSGNVFIADTYNNAIKELPRAFVDSTPKVEIAAAGSDTLPVVLIATANLAGPFAPTSDSTWLTISSSTNGVVRFAFATNSLFTSRTAHVTVLGQSIPVTQGYTPQFFLGTTNLLEGPSAGSDSVVLAANISWTATTNATWLHLSSDNQDGAGSTNVIFSFDANFGATRTGTLTIAGQTVTITQAGSNYVSTTYVTTLVSSNAITPFNAPLGVAVDGPGNVYIAGGSSIKKWTASTTNLTTLVSTGLTSPTRVAVDVMENLYISDTGNYTIKKWTMANSNVTTLVSGGVGNYGVAVDSAGNVYYCSGNTIMKWTAANSNVTTLVSSGSYIFQGVAVDGAGNVYIADSQSSAIKKWTAGLASIWWTSVG